MAYTIIIYFRVSEHIFLTKQFQSVILTIATNRKTMNPRAENCRVPAAFNGAGTFLITRFCKLNVLYCCEVNSYSVQIERIL